VGRFPCGSLVYEGTWWYGTYYVPTYPTGPSSGPGNVLTGGLLGPLVDFRHTTEFSPTNPSNASWYKIIRIPDVHSLSKSLLLILKNLFLGSSLG